MGTVGLGTVGLGTVSANDLGPRVNADRLGHALDFESRW